MTVLFMRQGVAIRLSSITGIEPIGEGDLCKVFVESHSEYLTVYGRSVVTTAWKQWLETEDKSLAPMTVTQTKIEQEERERSDAVQRQIMETVQKGRHR